MRQVIRDLDQVPGISEVIDPARLPSTRAAWGTSAYRAGLALFHGGIISRLPVPYRGLPRPPLSSRPRIAAVMDRFIAERTLVLRPESMDGLRGGLRRFGLWLDTERPHIESLAELTRADLVAFMQAVQEFRKVVVNYPRGAKVPTALYKEALTLAELKQTALAQTRLQYLLDHFPQSEEAPLAKERLAALRR